jgi:hypothetical protein
METDIQGSGQGLLYPERIAPLTTYMLELNISMRLQRKLHNNIGNKTRKSAVMTL